MSLFIRSQVEPEIRADATSTYTQYGPSVFYRAYLPEFCGMPVPIGDGYPCNECADAGRVNLIGA